MVECCKLVVIYRLLDFGCEFCSDFLGFVSHSKYCDINFDYS